MAYYYGANDEIIFKSEFGKFEGYSNLVFWIECKSTSRSAGNLTSYNTISVHAKRLDSNHHEAPDDWGGDESFNFSKSSKMHFKIEEVSYSTEIYGFVDYHEQSFGYIDTRGKTFSHDATGNKSITISAYFEGDVYKSKELVFVVDLPTIPLPADMTISEVKAGHPFSVAINTKLSSCNYYVAYRSENDDYYKDISRYRYDGYDARTVYPCKDFTLETNEYGWSNFYNNVQYSLETKTRSSFELICETYDNNYGYGKIGQDKRTVTITVPDDVKPTINGLTCHPMNPSCLYQEDGETYYNPDEAEACGYAKNVCMARLFICLDSISRNGYVTGSRLKSYKVWAVNPDGSQTVIKEADFAKDGSGNIIYHETAGAVMSYPSASKGYYYLEGAKDGIEVETPVLTTLGTVTYYATVTDRRGRVSDPVSVSINVVNYNKPIVANLRGYRSDSYGNYQEDGECIACHYEASYPSASDSAGAFLLKVYESDGTTLVETRTDLSREGNVANGKIVLINKPNHLTYQIELIVNSSSGSASKTITVYSTDALLDISPEGSVAIGKIADVYLDVNDSDEVLRLPMFEVNMVQQNYNHLLPAKDGVYDLGGGTFGNKWRTLYVVNCTCCSDLKYKENISYVSNSNKTRTSGQISQEDLHNFYKSDYQLATYNYIGQEQQEYGFVTSDMYDNSVGESLIIRNDNGDYFSINSYVSSIAGALQYEINLRDEQIAALQQEIQNLKDKIGL